MVQETYSIGNIKNKANKVKKGFNFYLFLSICIFSLFFTGCHLVKPPKLTTAPITDILPNSAVTGGNVTDDGNADVKARGVCWSTRKSPTDSDQRTTDGYGVGPFVSNITGLLPNTLYYVRAYASNKEETAYGNELTFTTAKLAIPELTTATVTGITQTAAVSGGNITFNGGTEVTERGVCWSTHTGPAVTDSKTTNGPGSGIFSSNITGLTGNTRYYVRAYATNSIGTGYGQEVSFTSGALLAVITTSVPSPTGTTTATGGGNITNDGGSAVTVRGICWSTAINPTTSNSRTTDGTGSGSFSSSMTGLIPNTRYHVRAYATNSVGTSYGSDLTFFTDPVSIQDYDNNVYNVIRIGTQVWLKENLKTTHLNDGTPIALVTGAAAWITLATPGYCWYNNNIANKNVYGALYNWYAVGTDKLCPTGWHVSTDDEILLLETFLSGKDVAGGKLKETGTSHWTAPNTGATDEFDFTALPGGRRLETTGAFEYLGFHGYWWTSTEPPTYPGNAWYRNIQNISETAFRGFWNDKAGMSVRCLKN